MLFSPIITQQGHSELAQEQYAHPFEDFQTSKVEFFSTSSILDQISLDDNEEVWYNESAIMKEVGLIFRAVGNDLNSTVTNQGQQKLQTIVNRANILYRSTILDYFAQTQRLMIQPKPEILESQQKLKQLIQDYHLYQKELISYEEFYQIYNQKNLKPEQTVRSMVKPQEKAQRIGFEFVEKVQILYKHKPSQLDHRKQSYDGQNARPRIKQNAEQVSDNKQRKTENQVIESIERLKQSKKHLSEQIYLLKLKQSHSNESHKKQLELANQLYNQRLQNIIELKLRSYSEAQFYEQGSKSVYSPKKENSLCRDMKLLQQIEKLSRDLQQQITRQKQVSSQLSSLHEQITAVKVKNLYFQQQLQQKSSHQQRYKFSLKPEDNKHYQQILTQQITLLKRQVQSQREKVYQLRVSRDLQKDQEVKRLKQQLYRQTEEIKFLMFQLDKVKIQKVLAQEKLLKVQQDHNVLKKTLQNSRSQLQTLRNSKISTNYLNGFSKTSQSFFPLQKSQQIFPKSPLKSHVSSQLCPNVKTLNIRPFLSDVLEGFVYFQCLQRQFRYRYLRGCLRQKQLLYKKNDFEVGVVTKVGKDEEGRVRFVVYLTNSSQQVLSNICLKVIGSNHKNHVLKNGGDKNYSLNPGDQVKVSIQVSVWQYPVGSISILISGLPQEIRLLLPFSILKMFSFEESSIKKQDIKTNSSYMSFKCETKVIKTFEWLVEGLLNSRAVDVSNQQIGLIGNHYQSGTRVKMWLQYNSQNAMLNVWYFKEIGNLDLVDYLMKTLRLIVQKEKK